MKKSFKHKALQTLFSVGLISASSFQANSSEIYRFVALDIQKPNAELKQLGSSFDFDARPGLALGLGKSIQLSSDWSLDTELSINYARSTIERSSANGDTDYGKLNEIGLWASTKFKRENLFEQVTPFVELSAGIVELDYKSNQGRSQGHQAAYKVVSGLEFNMAKGATISFGIGFNSTDDLEVPAPVFSAM